MGLHRLERLSAPAVASWNVSEVPFATEVAAAHDTFTGGLRRAAVTLNDPPLKPDATATTTGRGEPEPLVNVAVGVGPKSENARHEPAPHESRIATCASHGPVGRASTPRVFPAGTVIE